MHKFGTCDFPQLETVQQGRADAEQAAQVLQQQLDVAEARIQQLQGKLGSTRTRCAVSCLLSAVD